MSITRHNYEEFFILYMDNELSSDQRRMVEAFVQQHPDLKEELDVLLHYKMEPDESIVFTGKEELMKVNGETPVSLSNYEEWLVLYADNELTTSQRKTVDQFIASNPSIKEEMALMMKAKLQPEEIIFPNKESLYRKEERRVVPFRWWRIAAAAVIILLAVSAAFIFTKKPSEGKKPEVATTNPGAEKQNTRSTDDQSINTTNPVVVEKLADKNDNETAVAKKEKQSPVPVLIKQEKEKSNNTIAVTKEKPAIIINTPGNNSPVNTNDKKNLAVVDNNKPTNNLPDANNNPNYQDVKAVDKAVASVNNQKNNSQEVLTNNKVTITPTPPSGLSNDSDVSFASLEEGSSNKKSRGLFRKIARTFEKRTNIPATDDNRLLVGGLSFKLK